ncbi:hypothetical protein [uncultured Mediterranean phage uvDeep-CGR0-AD1-C123]|nr:hypothetical protein [uncultured Mediterranean phage uvDeep-CGR0-AD1-C123]
MVEINFEVQTSLNPVLLSGPIPAGEYEGEIVAADIKKSKSDSNMLVLEIQTDKGKVWDNLNLWHSNPKAVEIATERFNSLGLALGMSRIDDTEVLLAKRVRVRVGIQKKNPDFNEILGYAAVAPQTAPTAHPTVEPTQTAPAWSV